MGTYGLRTFIRSKFQKRFVLTWVQPFITKISHLGWYRRLMHKEGSDNPILSSLEKVPKMFCPLLCHYLTRARLRRSLTQANDNSSRCVMQLHKEKKSDGDVLSIIVHKQLVCIYLWGQFAPHQGPKAACWSTRHGGGGGGSLSRNWGITAQTRYFHASFRHKICCIVVATSLD